MIFTRICRHFHRALLALGILFFRLNLAHAQINVTNYGAAGDLLTLSDVITVSNSTAVTCPGASFANSDINKEIEIFGAGTYEGQSNEDLFVHIVSVSSPSTITISAAAQTTSAGLSAVYGTDDYPAFTNAIAHCPAPTGTILIPAGNYLVLPRNAFATAGHNSSLYDTLILNRGGITFAGQGTAVITGMGGWLSFGGQANRSALFAMAMPMTNNYPDIFSNLTFDGGVTVGNVRNLGYPASSSTGLGWDGTHHWMVTVAGSGSIIDSLVMLNCTIRHWRGEMMEETSCTPNFFLTASNCLFCDGNGSCINNFAHTCVSCIFSNANQAEEFYRSFTTNVSITINSTFNYLNDGIALNGGYYGDPTYTITQNTFTNFYGNDANGGGFALMTTPACDVVFCRNYVGSTNGIALGVAGYQDDHNTVNSNILVAFNTFDTRDYALNLFGSGNNWSENIYFFSNNILNAVGIAGGYGWSTNVYVFFNTSTNCGGFQEGQFGGQYFNDLTNQYRPIQLGYAIPAPNIFTYANGSKATIIHTYPSSVFELDDSAPAQIPPGAMMIVSNSDSLPWPLFSSRKTNTAEQILLPSGQSVTNYWTGSGWTTNFPSETQTQTPVVQVHAGTQSYGTILTGTRVTNSFTVENVGGGILSGAATAAAPFSVLPGGAYNLGPAQSQTISVVFAPATAGSYSQSVAFSGGGNASATVSGAATNAPFPVISLASGSISYGTILCGTSVTNGFAVQNSGTGLLTGAASVGAPFRIVSGGVYSLGPNQSQTVAVVFAPPTSGAFSQTLTFTGGAGANATVFGTGTNAAVVPPTVSAISANVSNLGTNAGVLETCVGTVQLSASASAANNDPLTWQWSYNVNGGAQTADQAGSGNTPTDGFTYSVNAGGYTYVWTLQVTDTSTGLSTKSQMTVYVQVPPVNGLKAIPQ